MGRSRLLITIVVISVLAAGLSAMSGRAAHAQDDIQDQASKLDQILANQKTILDEIASIKEELRIIKIRITQTQ